MLGNNITGTAGPEERQRKSSGSSRRFYRHFGLRRRCVEIALTTLDRSACQRDVLTVHGRLQAPMIGDKLNLKVLQQHSPSGKTD
jgi:hypothetical protein